MAQVTAYNRPRPTVGGKGGFTSTPAGKGGFTSSPGGKSPVGARQQAQAPLARIFANPRYNMDSYFAQQSQRQAQPAGKGMVVPPTRPRTMMTPPMAGNFTGRIA
jgi:hypothetical protein